MRNKTRAAALALICGVALAATSAAAQTGSQAPDPAMPGGAMTTPGMSQSQINPTSDQVQAFVKSLEGFFTQSLPGPKPTVGDSVPQDVKTHPMPPAAAEAVPQAKDHHVVKADDQTILIVDPITRQVVGVISASGSTTGVGSSNSDSGSSK
ncbi:MAG: hypothetical protein GEU91_00375 [Rhizobiales bacterium]|nr:hypothetical protein [Hyphomicrobiales bacterium]